MKLALFGLGGVGRLHLSAAQSLPDFNIVGLADPEASDIRELAAASGARSYRDADELLKVEKPDLAIVATPAGTHCALVTLCAEHGVNVLCEKPLAISLYEARSMIKACAASAVKLIYGASYRFLPAVYHARELIIEGTIGEVSIIRESLIGGVGQGGHVALGPVHYPTGGPGGSGLGLVDHGVHLIDAMEWMSGLRIDSVFGRGNLSGGAPEPEFLFARLGPSTVGILTYSDDTFSTDLPAEGNFSLGAGWDLSGRPVPPGGWQEQPWVIHVHGTDGSLRVHPYGHALFHRDRTGVRQLTLPGTPPPGHFAAQLNSAAAAVVGDKSSAPDGHDGLRALAVLSAVYRSSTTGCSVRPDDLLQENEIDVPSSAT